MRGSAIIAAALAAAISAGCGEGEVAPSPEEVRACLESGGADVVAPPLGQYNGLVFALADRHPSSVVLTGLPSGGVAAVGFYGAAEDAAATREALASAASLVPRAQRTETELHGNALVMWRRRAREGDQAQLASCLESGENIAGTVDEPVNPLGCVRVLLTTDSTGSDARRVESALHEDPLVRQARFVSKKAALAQLRRRFPELTKNLHGNPLPDSFEVSPRRGEQAPRIATRVRDDPGVDVVRVSSLPCSVAVDSSRLGG